MNRAYSLISIFLIFNLGVSCTDKISDLIVIDQKGNNTCIGDLDCFIDPPEAVTLQFKLTLAETLKEGKFQVTIERKEEDVLNEQLILCPDKGSSLTLTESCAQEVNAGSYTVTSKVNVPLYKDMATLTVSGPSGMSALRGLMSCKSSLPPIQLCTNGAC